MDVSHTTDDAAETKTDENKDTSDAKVILARQLLEEANSLMERVHSLLGDDAALARRVPLSVEPINHLDPDGEVRVIEGVFDGQKMIGPDGRQYAVPANYASKSKLVEGDLLKLTITEKGAFVYKQIGPIARRRLLGVLERAPLGADFFVRVGDRKYKVITASVTYFRGKEGDEVTILVPENQESKWAAVENILQEGEEFVDEE